jgi:hypothetical protein
MAFGDYLGSLTGRGDAVDGGSYVATGSVAVSVGDLIVIVVAELNGSADQFVGSTPDDNLLAEDEEYTAQNAGSNTDLAAIAFYRYVTEAGTLTDIDVDAVEDNDNEYVIVAVAFRGPFTDPPIDQNPANVEDDTSSPFTAPATGVLAQSSELVLAWAASDGTATWSATAPNVKRHQETGTDVQIIIGSQVTAATTSVTPAFTGSNPGTSVLGTMSFKAAVIAAALAADPVAYTISGTAAGLFYGREVVAGSVAYTINGASATLTLSSEKTLDAGAGLYTITGSDVTLDASGLRVINADTGEYIITGTAASLTYISPTGTVYVLHGRASSPYSIKGRSYTNVTI